MIRDQLPMLEGHVITLERFVKLVARVVVKFLFVGTFYS